MRAFFEFDFRRNCIVAEERFWQEYVEPLDSSSHSEHGAKIPSMEMTPDTMLLPLGDDILQSNIGLPIVVCITKV